MTQEKVNPGEVTADASNTVVDTYDLYREVKEDTGWPFVDIGYWLRTKPAELNWIFKDTVLRGIVTGIAGPGGAGKSMLILTLGISAACGKALLPSIVPVGPFRVMMFLGEDPDVISHGRFRNIVDLHQLDDETRQKLEGNLIINTCPAEPLFSVRDTHVQETPRFECMKAKVEEFCPDLIIIDPKARWSGLEENRNELATAFVTALEGLGSISNAAIIVTHHVPKSAIGKQNGLASRGASAFSDGTRGFMNVWKNNETGFVEVDITKSNYGPTRPKPIRLIHRPDFGGALEEMQSVVPKPIEQRLAEALADELAQFGPIAYSKLSNPVAAEQKDLRDRLNSKLGRWRKRVASAIEYGVKQGLMKCEEVPNRQGRNVVTVWSLKAGAAADAADNLSSNDTIAPDSDMEEAC